MGSDWAAISWHNPRERTVEMAMPRSIDARRYYRCADRRRTEAVILMDAAQPTGAVYLAGYVVECMLKALVIETRPAKQQGSWMDDLKRIGHDLTRLLEVYRRKGGTPPPDVVRAFNLVRDWSSEIRYDPKEVAEREAVRFLRAVDLFYQWSDGRL